MFVLWVLYNQNRFGIFLFDDKIQDVWLVDFVHYEVLELQCWCFQLVGVLQNDDIL